MHSAISYLTRYHLIVAVAATLLAAETYIVTDLPINYVVLRIIFLATLCAYNCADLEWCICTNIGKTKVEIQGSKAKIAIGAFSSLYILLLTPFLNLPITPLLILISICSFLYMNPIRLEQRRLSGIRNILLLKNIFLAFVWTATTVGVPLLEQEASLYSSDALQIFLRRFAFIFSLAVICDLRDVGRDRAAAVTTVAVKFGAVGTKLVALLGMLVFTALAIQSPSLSTRIPLLLSAIVAALAIVGANTSRKDLYYGVVVDGVLIVQFLLILLVS